MVKATSPGVALDMIITMKVAKNYRELLSKIEGSDFKSAVSFLSNPWTNGSARFLKKNKVVPWGSARKLKFDEILKQLDLPTVDYADSKKIVTP
eukprot:756792-Hanusia_phi.AAC.3